MKKLRTFGIFAHIDAGKTTTTEAFLLEAGQIARKGNIGDGTTTMDFMTQERARGITIQSAATCFRWGSSFFQLIDTPGHVDFSAEVQLALCAVDGACVLLDASRGVEAQTRAIWKALTSSSHHISKLIFVNKMDRDGVDMDVCLDAVRERLNAWPLQVNSIYRLPRAAWDLLGRAQAEKAGLQKKVHSVAPQAIIDLATLQTSLYPPVCGALDGSTPPLPVTYSPPPHVLAELFVASPTSSLSSKSSPSSSAAPLSPPFSPSPSSSESVWVWWRDARVVQDVRSRRAKLLEEASLLDDEFEAFWTRAAAAEAGDGGLEAAAARAADAAGVLRAELHGALKRIVLADQGVPVLFGSSFFSRGVTHLLDAVAALLPSPLERPPLRASSAAPPAAPPCLSACGSFLLPHRSGAASCVAFKVYPDGKGGRIAFVRVLSGRITPRTALFNSTKQCREPAACGNSVRRLYRIKADAYEAVSSLSSGDIGAIRGLTSVTAGDLLQAASACCPAFSLPILAPFQRHLAPGSPQTAGPAAAPGAPAPLHAAFSTLHSLSPVCFSAIECGNAREETEVGEALAAASLSDVALKFEKEEGGKFTLWGMGQLHLQVVQARLREEFGLSVEFGPLEIAYRELLLQPVRGALTYSPAGGSAASFEIAFSLLPLPLTPAEQRLSALLSRQEDPALLAMARVEALPLASAVSPPSATAVPSLSGFTHATNLFFSLSPEAETDVTEAELQGKKGVHSRRGASHGGASHGALAEGGALLQAIREAVVYAAGAGPLLSYPLDCLHIRLERLRPNGPQALLTPPAVSAASAQLLRLLLRTGKGERARGSEDEDSQEETDLRERVAMLEPVMHLEICSPAKNLGALMKDLTQQRRASIVSISAAAGESAEGCEAASIGDAPGGEAPATSGELKITGGDENGMMELHAVVPLRCMEDYSSVLRALSHGQAHFQLRPLGYGRLSPCDEEELLDRYGCEHVSLASSRGAASQFADFLKR
ncbi:elongation factor G C-terminus domain-containing protein [Besnoitia besnoiti]|uniref:Elongation factor G C-terminus domain-containing protein n=1 Tax=Besnoitia besnoiti TaxID=94643 RepID=A0A2A9MNL8_BESBE|nr:elongation factor G C-terminus domain-containing protein [Besnoitia besnoiti]PFH37497.1 elongation factor G C-terminus domain-containing protein [Besnoitia besnoiti]